MLLFHGTTIENAKQILKEGFNYNSSVWGCSEEKTYFYTEDHIRSNLNDSEELSREEIIAEGVRTAMQQARITLAVQNPSDYRGVVLVFDSSLMKNKEELEVDYSCENMEDSAVCVRKPDMNGLVHAFEMNESEACFRFFELCGYIGNPYRVDLDLTATEESLIKMLKNSDAYSSHYDLMSEREYQQIILATGDLEEAA